MSDLKSANMGWGERFAIMEKFNLDDAAATSAFGVSADELSTARELMAAGVISPAHNVDYSAYEQSLRGVTRPDTDTPPSPTVKPVTATKPTKTPKKRGRKGDKIAKAFLAVPTDPTDAEAFAAEHSVSMAVLKQSKRFDKSGLPPVKVRKDKASGKMMIWREGE